jgi:hypothetical protein
VFGRDIKYATLPAFKCEDRGSIEDSQFPAGIRTEHCAQIILRVTFLVAALSVRPRQVRASRRSTDC